MSNNDLQSQADAIISRHPLQRFRSPSRGLSSIFHVRIISTTTTLFQGLLLTQSRQREYPALRLHSNTLLIGRTQCKLENLEQLPIPILTRTSNDSYGWHFQYLTIIGLSLATLTFTFGSLADITLSPRLFLIKNALSMCSAPLEVLISVLYWSLRAIDKNLVMPEWAQLDPWADVGFHAIPAIVLVIDLLFFSPPWTITALPTIGVSGVLAGAYWLWVERCYAQNGWYPYPLFEVLPPPYRAAVFAGSAAVMTLSTATLKWLYGRVNGYGVGSGPRTRPGAVKQ
ncbi:hypothetical protein MMC06_001948 [Schaereria dolodes]|nr:hypothetical protein [Schaereria dolodes]